MFFNPFVLFWRASRRFGFLRTLIVVVVGLVALSLAVQAFAAASPRASTPPPRFNPVVMSWGKVTPPPVNVAALGAEWRGLYPVPGTGCMTILPCVAGSTELVARVSEIESSVYDSFQLGLTETSYVGGDCLDMSRCHVQFPHWFQSMAQVEVSGRMFRFPAGWFFMSGSYQKVSDTQVKITGHFVSAPQWLSLPCGTYGVVFKLLPLQWSETATQGDTMASSAPATINSCRVSVATQHHR